MATKKKAAAKTAGENVTAAVRKSLSTWKADQEAARESGPPKDDLPTGAHSHPPE